MSTAHESEGERVLAAAAGDMEAFESLYREHVGRVNALCLRMTRNPTEAEELVQDVFVRVYQKLDAFRGESAFSTWIHRIAVNTTIEHLRRRSRWRERHDASVDPESSLDRTFAQSAGADLDLEYAIARLPEQARLVFVMHDIEGYKHKEIAEQSGIAVGTCKAHLHRARQLLRERLDPQGATQGATS